MRREHASGRSIRPRGSTGAFIHSLSLQLQGKTDRAARPTKAVQYCTQTDAATPRKQLTRTQSPKRTGAFRFLPEAHPIKSIPIPIRHSSSPKLTDLIRFDHTTRESELFFTSTWSACTTPIAPSYNSPLNPTAPPSTTTRCLPSASSSAPPRAPPPSCVSPCSAAWPLPRTPSSVSVARSRSTPPAPLVRATTTTLPVN